MNCHAHHERRRAPPDRVVRGHTGSAPVAHPNELRRQDPHLSCLKTGNRALSLLPDGQLILPRRPEGLILSDGEPWWGTARVVRSPACSDPRRNPLPGPAAPFSGRARPLPRQAGLWAGPFLGDVGDLVHHPQQLLGAYDHPSPTHGIGYHVPVPGEVVSTLHIRILPKVRVMVATVFHHFYNGRCTGRGTAEQWIKKASTL
jgi:hypothetical protein